HMESVGEAPSLPARTKLRRAVARDEPAAHAQAAGISVAATARTRLLIRPERVPFGARRSRSLSRDRDCSSHGRFGLANRGVCRAAGRRDSTKTRSGLQAARSWRTPSRAVRARRRATLL